MSRPVADSVFETTASTGTGTLNLGGAVGGYRRFRTAFSTGAVVAYVIQQATYANGVLATLAREIGLGTLTHGQPDTLSRDRVLSQHGGAALNGKLDLVAGGADVFCAAPAVLAGAGARSVAANTSLDASDIHSTIFATGGSTGIRITLPDGDGLPPGAAVRVVKVDAGAGSVILDGHAAQTLNGVATLSLASQHDVMTVIWEGAGWYAEVPVHIPNIPAGLPTGALVDFAGQSAPNGFLPCDGRKVSRAIYAALYAVIGTLYGAGDGSTTFTLPDFRRRVAVGSGGTGTTTLASAVGSTGGAETHTLTTAEIASHTHDEGTLATASAGSHNHDDGTLAAASAGSHTHDDGTLATASAGSHTHDDGTLAAASAGSHTHDDGTLATASAGSHTHKYNQRGSAAAAIHDPSDGQSTKASTLSEKTTSSAGGHTHSVSGNTGSAGGHTHSVSGNTGSAGGHTHSVSGNTGSAGGHTHSVSGDTGSVGGHTHSVSGNTGSAGSGDAHNNMQPAVVVTKLIKT